MDTVSKKKRSEIMSRIRNKNTVPELMVRKYIYARGHRYRLHVKKLPGCPDIVVSKHKLAIQVRGCFWHGHRCRLGNSPKSNRFYWSKKIKLNRKRDEKNDRKLKYLGYKLLVIRECGLKGRKYKEKVKQFFFKYCGN